jgi:hypothetical protein
MNDNKSVTHVVAEGSNGQVSRLRNRKNCSYSRHEESYKAPERTLYRVWRYKGVIFAQRSRRPCDSAFIGKVEMVLSMGLLETAALDKLLTLPSKCNSMVPSEEMRIDDMRTIDMNKAGEAQILNIARL